jgi:stearoyl-CoA desaturase (delta-9 desaturase)
MHSLLFTGAFDLPWWGYVLVALALTHVTIASVTIYLHRCQAHRALELHPIVSHVFRFWLWISTGMATREWVAVHRKHHAFCEKHGDPHSPQVYGIRKVLWKGGTLRPRPVTRARVERFGDGTPDDWLERTVYAACPWQGVGLLMLLADLAMFGAIGATVWAADAWIPITAAGIINGLGHYWGYRNFRRPMRPPTSSPSGS